jgi:DNA-directed RNA polymerase specialized sigma subunit
MILDDLKQTNNRRKSKYQDEKLESKVIEQEKLLKDASEKFNAFQHQLAMAFYILSENIAKYAKFSGIDIDDAIQEGVFICLEKIDRFNPLKGKAFNYMTTVILNSLRQHYRSANNYNELKKRYHAHLQDQLESALFRGQKDSFSKRVFFDRDTGF